MIVAQIFLELLKNKIRPVSKKSPGNSEHFLQVDFISKKIVPTFYTILQKQDKDDQDAAKTVLLNNLENLVKHMAPKGPFFQGETFGYVDIMLAPYAIRLGLLSHYRDLVVPKTGVFERFQTWFQAVQSRESVKATVPEWNRLVQMYQRYADNSAQTEVADAIRKGGVLP